MIRLLSGSEEADADLTCITAYVYGNSLTVSSKTIAGAFVGCKWGTLMLSPTCQHVVAQIHDMNMQDCCLSIIDLDSGHAVLEKQTDYMEELPVMPAAWNASGTQLAAFCRCPQGAQLHVFDVASASASVLDFPDQVKQSPLLWHGDVLVCLPLPDGRCRHPAAHQSRRLGDNGCAALHP